MHALAVALGLLCLARAQATGDDRQWEKVGPAESGFEILMPGAPKSSARTVHPLPNRSVIVHLVSVAIKDNKALFMVGYHDLLEPPGDAAKIRDVLDGGVKGSVLNALGKLLKNEPITLGEHPGRHFEYAGNRFNQRIQGDSRIYLVGRRMYQITVLHAPNIDVAAESTKFFESFKLTADGATPNAAEPFSTTPAKDSAPAKPATAAGK